MGATCCQQGEGSIERPVNTRMSRPADKKIKIEYFEGGYGRADPLVQLLKHAKQDFEYITVSQVDWMGTRKAQGTTGEFGVLPIVHYRDMQYQQTIATLRMLGIQFGYYDQSNWRDVGFIDMICETEGECFNSAAKIMFFTKEDEKQAEIEKFADGQLRKLLQICEDKLTKNGLSFKYLVSNKLNIADFALASLTFNIIKNENGPFAKLCT